MFFQEEDCLLCLCGVVGIGLYRFGIGLLVAHVFVKDGAEVFQCAGLCNLVGHLVHGVNEALCGDGLLAVLADILNKQVAECRIACVVIDRTAVLANGVGQTVSVVQYGIQVFLGVLVPYGVEREFRTVQLACNGSACQLTSVNGGGQCVVHVAFAAGSAAFQIIVVNNLRGVAAFILAHNGVHIERAGCYGADLAHAQAVVQTVEGRLCTAHDTGQLAFVPFGLADQLAIVGAV